VNDNGSLEALVERKMKITIKDLLIQELKKKGVQPSQIPGFIRAIENTFLDNPFVSLIQANSHLQSLGWDDIQLDHPTFLLAQEYLRDEYEG